MTITQLSELSAIERSSLGRAIDTMEARGLIQRVGRINDKRMQDVEITADGSELYKQILPLVERWNERVTHGIKGKDIATTIETLKMIRANFFDT